MDVRIRERLVGALVLVAVVVLLVPSVLTGPDHTQDQTAAVPTRSVEVRLDDATEPARDDVLVPEPAAAGGAEPSPRTLPVAAPVSPPASEPAGAAASAAAPPRPAATPPAVAGAGAAPAWAVQLGAFSTRDKAERLVADLKKRGYPAFVLEYRATGQVLHRVRVGPEQDRARAVAIAERLRKDGFQPVVAPHP